MLAQSLPALQALCQVQVAGDSRRDYTLTEGSTHSPCRSYDEGCVMVKLGREEPVASMDNSGKIIWARHNEVQTVNIKSLGDVEEVGAQQRPCACSLHCSAHVWACVLGMTAARCSAVEKPAVSSADLQSSCLFLFLLPHALLLPPQTDGERLPLAVKDLGSSDIYPQSLQHSPNGRFVTGARSAAPALLLQGTLRCVGVAALGWSWAVEPDTD